MKCRASIPVLFFMICGCKAHGAEDLVEPIKIGEDKNTHTAWTGYVELSDPGVDPTRVFHVVITWLSGMDMKDGDGKKIYPRTKEVDLPLGKTPLDALFYGNATLEGGVSARCRMHGKLYGDSFPMHRP